MPLNAGVTMDTGDSLQLTSCSNTVSSWRKLGRSLEKGTRTTTGRRTSSSATASTGRA